MYGKIIITAVLLTALLVTPIAAPAATPASAPAQPNVAEEMALADFIAAKTEDAPYAVRLAMAAVLLNRVGDGRYPDTVSGILAQAGYTAGGSARRSRAYQSARSAVRCAAEGMDITDGATAWARAGTMEARGITVTFTIDGWLFGKE